MDNIQTKQTMAFIQTIPFEHFFIFLSVFVINIKRSPEIQEKRIIICNKLKVFFKLIRLIINESCVKVRKCIKYFK